MNVNDRFKYYIKNWRDKTTVIIPDYTKTIKQNEVYYIKEPTCWPGNLDIISNQKIDIKCLILSDDGIDNKDLPVLCKVRYITSDKGGILLPIQYGRHWNCIKEARNNNICWENKIGSCVWRGASTGNTEQHSDPNQYKNKRMLLCHKYHNIYNVGISALCQGWNNESYFKAGVSIEYMLDYKYIISIEGNDKDSGLNWKLASKSLVLMIPPTIESWLMEGLLLPYIHYVPLNEDLSDLPNIIQWCEDNQDKCIEIIGNANTFMKQFDDFETEIELYNMIKTHYKNTVILCE